MSEPYYRLDPYATPRPVIEWDPTYDMLRGPDGFECLLTEPEDRTWWRDGKDVVVKLNEQHTEIERLQQAHDDLARALWQLQRIQVAIR